MNTTDEFCNKILAGMAIYPHIFDITVRIVISILLAVIPVAAIMGNMLVIISVVRNPRLRTSTNAFVVSLAMADICISLLVMPYTIYLFLTNQVWLLGDMSCRMVLSFCVMLCSASIYNLCCIAINRYLGFCRPFLHLGPKVVALMLIVCWVAPVFLSFLPLMNKWHHIGIEHIIECTNIFWKHKNCNLMINTEYALLGTLFAFYIPVVLMSILNWKIYQSVIHQLREMVQIRMRFDRNKVPQDERIARSLIIITACFILSWSPVSICTILDPFVNYSINGVLWQVCLWTGFANSAANPVLLYIFNKRFRIAFDILFHKCKVRFLFRYKKRRSILYRMKHCRERIPHQRF